MARVFAAALLGCLLHSAQGKRFARGGSLRSARAALEGYSFAQYARDFGRSYAAGSEELRRRAALFDASLEEVRATNARNEEEGRGWRAGVHPFMDWTPEEKAALNGYKPSRMHGGRRAAGAGVSLLHQGAAAFAGTSAAADLNASASTGGMSADYGPALRQQGNCGSCWAISAVEAVEAQLIRNGGGDMRLAAQALVDCVPNPQHCGGSGGCDGATGELAYTFMREHGIPLESELPYRARTGTCEQAPLEGVWRSPKRVRVDGWNQLPSNQLEPLKTALVQQGPTVVAVDGNNWFNYDSGVFDSCDKDAILGHAVLAKGFGEDGGKKYWLIQNSWGSDWGENGHIRMLMHDDEEHWCGVDRKPKEGVGCDGGPSEVTVCGMCGILFDPIIPTGVRLESADDLITAGAGPDSETVAGASSEARMDALLHRMGSS